MFRHEQQAINVCSRLTMWSDCWKSKSLIEKGVNIAGIKQVMNPVSKESEDATVVSEHSEVKRTELSDTQLHRLLKQQLLEKRPGKASLIQGQLSRFYNKQ